MQHKKYNCMIGKTRRLFFVSDITSVSSKFVVNTVVIHYSIYYEF